MKNKIKETNEQTKKEKEKIKPNSNTELIKDEIQRRDKKEKISSYSYIHMAASSSSVFE